MPTYDLTPRFKRDLGKLDGQARARFKRVVQEQFLPDLRAARFRARLRIKRVQGWPGVFEMTWAPDGRATWAYDPEQRPGEPHVIWRRVGTHEIVDPGPP